jgi:hypothetical protein
MLHRFQRIVRKLLEQARALFLELADATEYFPTAGGVDRIGNSRGGEGVEGSATPRFRDSRSKDLNASEQNLNRANSWMEPRRVVRLRSRNVCSLA